MKFGKPVIAGTLIKRYKRFFADVLLDDGRTVTAHCPNTGSMKTCGDPGDSVLLTCHNNPARKLQFTWELTRSGNQYIGVNTSLPNGIVKEAIADDLVPELSGYDGMKSEVKYGKNSRIDLLLTGPRRPDCYVEVKNVTLRDEDAALFPDAVTSRGLKHLVELQAMTSLGYRAVMFYLINRQDVSHFKPAWHIDLAYCTALQTAQQSGVELIAYRTNADHTGIWLDQPVPIDMTTAATTLPACHPHDPITNV